MRRYLPVFYPALDDEIRAAATILAVGAKGSYSLSVYDRPSAASGSTVLEVGLDLREPEQLPELLQRVRHLRGELTPEAARLSSRVLCIAAP